MRCCGHSAVGLGARCMVAKPPSGAKVRRSRELGVMRLTRNVQCAPQGEIRGRDFAAGGASKGR